VRDMSGGVVKQQPKLNSPDRGPWLTLSIRNMWPMLMKAQWPPLSEYQAPGELVGCKAY